MLCGYYFYLFTQTVKSLEYWIGDLNKNLTNGRSHAHVVVTLDYIICIVFYLMPVVV